MPVPLEEKNSPRVMPPLFWNGLASQTLAAAPENRPTPPRSWVGRSLSKV
jgi:hypothetical protein